MSDISNIYSKIGASYEQAISSKSVDTNKSENTEATGKSKISGKTVGKPQLSEKAAKYYEQLKSKFHNMEFVLVSEEEKEAAKAKASSFAKKNRMVVLIDEAKIEKMAEDESYRKQYEGIIEKAAVGLTQFASQASSLGANIKGYGVEVNDDGTSSYFAVLQKSSDAQSKRIAEKRAEKIAEKKAETKKEQKEQYKERIENARETRKSEKAEFEKKLDKSSKADKSNEVLVTANSLEELLRKVEDQVQMEKSDLAVTDAEKVVGQHIDFSA